MLVRSFPADAFGTNCYVLATGPGQECVVVDPGIGVVTRLDEVLRSDRLQPVAVMLTHGHIDHVFSVTPVCGVRNATAYIHPGDREMLADPTKGLSTELTQLFGGRLPYAEPDRVEPLPDAGTIEVAGLAFSVEHAPGHTEGSVLFGLDGSASSYAAPLCLSGDVLFAGSIGRTDLPGGSFEVMLTTLRDKILPLPDEMVVLPGHGPATTIGRERLSNPFLLELIGLAGAPSRKIHGW